MSSIRKWGWKNPCLALSERQPLCALFCGVPCDRLPLRSLRGCVEALPQALQHYPTVGAPPSLPASVSLRTVAQHASLFSDFFFSFFAGCDYGSVDVRVLQGTFFFL